MLNKKTKEGEEDLNNDEEEPKEEYQPKISKLDEIFDNILYEKPILDDPRIMNKSLTLEETICI